MKKNVIAWILTFAMLCSTFSSFAYAIEVDPGQNPAEIVAQQEETPAEDAGDQKTDSDLVPAPEAEQEEDRSEAVLPRSYGARAIPNDDSLVLFYDFESVDGETVADASGNGYDGTLLNGAAVVDNGKEGKAVDLAGEKTKTDADGVLIPVEAFEGVTDYTLEADFYLDNSVTWTQLFTMGKDRNYIVLANQGTPMSVSVGLTIATMLNGGTEDRVKSGSPDIKLPTGEWSHLTYTQKGATGKLYINSELVGTGTINTTPDDLAQQDGVTAAIGQSRMFPDPGMDGRVDNFAIYSRAKTQAEITGEAGDDLLLYYNFEEADGMVVPDESGNGFDGTMTGNAALVNSRDGKAIKLSSGTDYVEIPMEVVNGIEDVTIMADVWLDSVSTWTALFAAGSNVNDVNCTVMAAKGAPGGAQVGYTLGIRVGGVEQRISAPVDKTVPVGRWARIAYTQEGSTARLYIDGEVVAEKTDMTNTIGDAYVVGEKCYLAKSPYPADPTATGRIDNFKIYTRALSADELVADVMANQEIVEKDKAALDLGEIAPFTGDRLELPLVGENGAKIYWETSDPAHIVENGIVIRDKAEGKAVTLTATLVSGDVSDTKEFTVELKADPKAVAKKPMNILQIGDSNTEFGWLTMNMKELLNEDYGDYGTGFVTLAANSYFQKQPKNFSFTRTGGWTDFDTARWGIHGTTNDSPNGIYARGDTGAEMTINFVGSAIDLFYLSWNGAGNFSVTIDGVDKGTVYQNQPNDYKTHAASYDGLKYGSHVMQIKINQGHVNFYGADAIIGERDSRAIINTLGNAEATSNDFAILTESIFDSFLKLINPDKIVVLLGTNDHGALAEPRQPADVEQDLITVLNRVKAALPDKEIWLLSTFDTNDTSKPASKVMLREYWKTTFPNAAAATGIRFWDMGPWFGDWSSEKMSDAWHCNDQYGMVIMKELYSKLNPELDPATVVSYDFESVSGSTVADMSGNGFDGTLVKGAAVSADGKDGSAVSLIGGKQDAASGVDIPIAAFEGVTDYTLEADYYLDESVNWTQLFTMGKDGSNYIVLANQGNPSLVKVGLTLATKKNGGAEDRVKSGSADVKLPVSEWAHLTYTQEGATGKLYINNELVGTGTINTTPDDLSKVAGAGASIGRSLMFGDPGMVGKVDNFTILSRAKSEFEITGEEPPVEFVDDPILNYTFEENEGGKVIDQTGNGYDGTFKGSVTLADGKIGSGALFGSDGSNSIEINGEVLNGLTDMTLSGDVYLTAREAWTTLFSAGSQSGAYITMAAQGNPGGKPVGITVAIKNPGTSEQRIAAAEGVCVDTGRWVNFVYTQEGSTAKLYLDGTLVAVSSSMTNTFGGVYDAGPVMIGKSVWPDPNAIGTFDNFKIYNRALSEAEILADLERKELMQESYELELESTTVYADIQLPESKYGNTITWKSSDSAYLGDDGKVTRPADENKTVTLTATISNGSVEVAKEFSITVLANTPAVNIDIAKAALTLPKGTRANLDLPAKGEFGANITWSSKTPELISDTGMIIRSQNYQTATLTANIELGGLTASKDIEVNVIGLDELVNYYSFDGDAADLISGANGVLKSGAKIEGGNLVLDGVDDYVEMPANWIGGAADTEALTISLWTEMDAKANWEGLFHVSSGNDRFLTIANQGNPSNVDCGLIWSWYTDGMTGQQTAQASPADALPADQWSHVAATYENGEAVVYLDGKEVARSATDGTIAALGDTVNNYIGKTIFSADPTFSGRMNDYKIFYRALSAQEIADESAQGLLNIAADALDLGDLSHVTESLTLPATGLKGTAITWKSDKPEFIAADGNINLPNLEQGNQTVVLTAVISKDGKSVEKSFTATVVAMSDEDVAAKDAEYLQRAIDYLINDGYELPKAKSGSNVVWTITEGDANLVDNVITKTGTSDERQLLKLKGVVTKGDVVVEVVYNNVILMDEFVGYVLSFFGANGAVDAEHQGVNNPDEKFRMAYSYDGVHWEKLNNNYPVVYPTMGDTKRVRDPFIMRNKDGSFSVLATQGWDTPYIYAWHSENLTEFTNERLLRASQSGVAGLTGSRAWAPEGSYDPITDQYYLYWADPSARGENGSGPIYYNTSKDLESLSTPGIYFDPGYQIIDSAIIKHDGVYYMAFKDERESGKAIKFAKSTSLAPGSFEIYTDEFVTDKYAEGPFVFKANGENKWFHYWDFFYASGDRFGYSVTDDLASGEWTYMGKNPNMPSGDVRHGGVVPVTQKELDAILAKWTTGDEILTVKGAVESELEVKGNVPFAELALPETARLLLSNGKVESFPVVWSEEGYVAGEIGSYTLTGAVTLPDNVTNPSGFQASIVVKVVAESEQPSDVDKTELGALIELAEEALKSPAYTQESLKALTEELEAARLVMENGDATQDAVNDARNALEAAYQGLKLNLETELLTMSIALSKRTIEEYDLTQDSIEMLQAVIDEAEALLQDSTATQKQINDMYRKVMKTLALVVEREDRTLLSAAIDSAQSLTEAQYTPTSWAALAEALSEALKVEADDYATQEAIDAAYQSLMKAMTALELRAQKAALESAVKLAQALVESGNYSEESLRYVTELLDSAEALLTNGDAAQEAVDQMAEDLTCAIAKVRLMQAVAEVNELNAARYTAASWNAVQAVKAEAKALLANENATAEELNGAATKLANAVKGLKTKGGSSGSVSKVSDSDYWNGIIEKINSTAKSGTVNATLESGAMTPATVIDAAAAKGVALNIEIGGKAYLLSNYAIDASAVYYSAAELIAMADGETAAQSGAISLNPETGGEVAATVPNAAAPAGEAASANETIGGAQQAAAEQGENLSDLWLLVLAAAAIGGVSLVVVRKKHQEK
ncbi:LamG-like jellyroll fold domain-containing protein [Ligaoa zhengdingensis]|uniref:LamG-like jellyroll fold domain-containing protein n=1 Tax=Ligaoa zhengdingensis TaxID=2763658 RepID=UPI0031BBAA4E